MFNVFKVVFVGFVVVGESYVYLVFDVNIVDY